MAASITQTTVLPKSASKLYTNTGNSDVVATLNMVSQSATKNPKMNVAYSSSSNLLLNTSSDASWTLPETTDSDACPIGLNSSLATKGTNAYAVNIVDEQYGAMVSANAPTTYTSNKYASQFLDPYYLVSPTSWNSIITTPAFGKQASGAGFNFWWDFNEPMANGTWATLFGNSPSYTTGQDNHRSMNYYDQGLMFDPYSSIALSVDNSGYVSLNKNYMASFGNTSISNNTGDRTSDSCLRDQLTGSNFSSYNVPQAQHPWARNLHCDNYMFVIDSSRFTTGASDVDGNCFILLNFKPDLGTPYQSDTIASISTYIDGPYGLRVKLATANTLRWIKYHPVSKKWFFCIGGDDSCTGLYSLTDASTTFKNSGTGETAGTNQMITAISLFTKEADFNFPDEKMTLPARISEESWLSYDSSGNSYTSTDLIVWSAIASVDGLLPTGYVMKNTGSDGVDYYAKKGSAVIKTAQSGYTLVDKSGWIESQTEVGRYERTGIIIPKGQSLYLENKDSTSSVSASLLTMDI